MNSVIVDWQEALNQVSGDKDFLKEVLQDLMDEAKTAETNIADGITNKNFEETMKAAHRIKGSASYLGCEALRDSALFIQQKSHEGLDHPEKSEELLTEVQDQYKIFLECVSALSVEIERWFRENPN
jgi:HPt (histidine-containing phosphotransfer) domain-containing protein